MKFGVAFSVDVDGVETPLVDAGPELEKMLVKAVGEAVTTAIRHAEGNGHVHSMDDTISILMDSEVSVRRL